MRRGSTSISEFLRDPSGSLTVEFIAVTPMLLIALIFGIDYGRELWAYDTVVRDLRSAVRYLQRAELDCSNTDSAQTNAKNLAQYGNTAGSGSKHFPWNNGTATFTIDNTSTFSVSNYNVSGTLVTMTANVPVNLLGSQFGTFFTKYTGSSGNLATSQTLTVAYQARCIGN
jgi:Flp pilus assembly protein TadG